MPPAPPSPPGSYGGAVGLDADFDFYEDLIEDPGPGIGPGGAQRPGGHTLERSKEWLRSVANEPFFFFFHITQPHTPYSAPEPFRSATARRTMPKPPLPMR